MGIANTVHSFEPSSVNCSHILFSDWKFEICPFNALLDPSICAAGRYFFLRKLGSSPILLAPQLFVLFSKLLSLLALLSIHQGEQMALFLTWLHDWSDLLVYLNCMFTWQTAQSLKENLIFQLDCLSSQGWFDLVMRAPFLSNQVVRACLQYFFITDAHHTRPVHRHVCP